MPLDLKDKTIYLNHLTNVNGVTVDTTPPPPFAISQQAAQFVRASAQRLNAVESTSLKPTGSITIEAWIKVIGAAGYGHIVTNVDTNDTNPNGYDVYILPTDQIQFIIGRNTGAIAGTDYQVKIGTATNWRDGNWHHLAVVYNGSNLQIYQDGVVDGGSAGYSNGIAYSANVGFNLGGAKSGGVFIEFWNGSMEEVRLWNVARTLTQIQDNRNRRLGGSEVGLQTYYPFEPLGGGGGFLHNII